MGPFYRAAAPRRASLSPCAGAAIIAHSELPSEEAQVSESRSELAEAAKLVDIRSPQDEFRSLVEARVETMLKLGAGSGPRGGASAARVELYREALELGLALIGRAPAPGTEGRSS
jgi:hypothetical protein